MGGNGDSRTRRVELSGGQWADVRATTKLRDQADVERVARERGYESDYMDAMERLRLRIVGWSLGEVTTDNILELSLEDGNALFGAMRDDDPNASTPSSDGGGGTTPKAKSR